MRRRLIARGRSGHIFATLVIVFVLGLCGCTHVARIETPPTWAHERTDLKPDPGVLWGRLENGLRYAILPHDHPHARVSVYFLVQAGSYQERANERGYAHFVEHMAFRDLRDFPGDSVAQALQRLGVASGAHVNAATGPFETEYFFNHLPSDDPDALPTALKIMRGVADGIEFHARGVEQERGVIFSEQRSRSGNPLQARARPDELEYLPPRDEMPRWPEVLAVFAGTRLAKRYPLGEEKSLQNATARKLRAFYERCYRPERMFLAVAGDVKPSEAEELIRRTFTTLTGSGRAALPLQIELPRPLKVGEPRIHIEALLHEPAIHLTMAAARSTAADGTRRRRETLARNVALAMLVRRLDRESEKPNSPIVSAEASVSHLMPAHDLTLLRVTAGTEAWPNALVALEVEMKRAHKFGFEEDEFARAVKKAAQSAASRARQSRTQPSSALAAALAYSMERGIVFTSAEDDRHLVETDLATLTLAECQAALVQILPAGQTALALLGPFGDEERVSAMLNTALTESANATVVAYEPPPASKPFPYTDFGSPGNVATEQRSELLDTELLLFENGVRLNLKRTKAEPGRVRMVLRFGGGRFEEPPDKPGLPWRSFAWIVGGLRDFSRDDERAAFAEHSGGFTMTANPEDFRIVADGEAESLPLLLQAMTAYFVYPAFREDSWPRALELARPAVAPFEGTARGVATAALNYRMYSEHFAQRSPRMAEVSQRTLDELKAWLLPQLVSGPLEIALIGDFDPLAARDMVARTFGALPRRPIADPYTEQRKIAFPPKPFAETISFEGSQSLAVVSLAWPAPGVVKYSERFRGHIVASILGDRIRRKLRMEMGETYAPSATFAWNDAFTPAPVYLTCDVEAAPDRVAGVAEAIRAVAETLVRDGATEEEFERARRPLVRETEMGLRDNGWWLDGIAVAQSMPGYAEGWARALTDYRTATLDEINGLIRRVMVKENECSLIVVPKAPAAPETNPTATSGSNRPRE
jgi:zinc protease